MTWIARLSVLGGALALFAGGLSQAAQQEKPENNPNVPNPCRLIADTAEARGCWEKSAKRGDKNLKGANLERANLAGVELKGANLEGASLVGAKLTEISFWEANLRKANLSGADLTGAFVWGADLTSANLTKAVLLRADFEKSDLRKANLTGANLKEMGVAGVSFKGALMPDGNPYDKESNPPSKYGTAAP